jgi:hypothetical protein
MSLKDLRYLASNPIPNLFYDRRTIQVWSNEVLQLFLIIDKYDKCINEMRDENKIHGHITDSSAQYLINIKPMYESMRVIAESNTPITGQPPEQESPGQPPIVAGAP